MRRYEVYIKGREELSTQVVALNAGKARYSYWLDLQDASYNVHWRDLRSRAMGRVCELRKPNSEEERKKLEILRHACGLDHLGLNQQGGREGHRNYYALYQNSDDFELCMSMCSSEGRLPLLGCRDMDKLAEGMVYFHVTIGGKDFLDKRTGMDHLTA